MSVIQITALVIFIAGYSLIVFEHSFKINKSAAALGTGILLWLLIAVDSIRDFHRELLNTQIEVFELIIFLLGSVALLELLIQYKFFDYVQQELCKLHISEKYQFLLITFVIFLLSTVINNLTVTIVGIRIAMLFFRDKKLLYAAVGIVIASNAGGAFSPIGDVTTLMLWLANKFTVLEILAHGFLPSFLMYLVSIGLLCRVFSSDISEGEVECTIHIKKTQWFMIILTLVSFVLPIVTSFLNLPPYFGLLAGLSVVWFLNDFIIGKDPKADYLCENMTLLLQKADFSSVLFFIGILLSVGALDFIGILNLFSGFIFGTGTEISRIVVGNSIIGLISSVVDNVPMTAIVLKMLDLDNASIWVLLAYTVGTGGSILSIGSASGVIAMSMLGELNFRSYFKIGAVPALLGYLAGIVVWCIQYFIFHF